MAVKIRLARHGSKANPFYRIVVADSRSPRDGRYIERIGTYDPQREPSAIEVDNEKASEWLSKGAQPTGQVRKLLEISGAI
ncbi:30S ribosomal protein S16 [soil metagenome]